MKYIRKTRMCWLMLKLCSHNTRRSVVLFVGLNESLDLFHGSNNYSGVNYEEINDIILHIVLHRWDNQAYTIIFDSEAETYHVMVNLFEIMRVFEKIYKGVMDKYSKNTLGNIIFVKLSGKWEKDPTFHKTRYGLHWRVQYKWCRPPDIRVNW